MKTRSILLNENGYAMAIMAALLPVLMGLLLLSSAVLIIIKTDQQYQHTCRLEGTLGQYKVAPHLKALLALNPVSKVLRAKKTIAMAKIVAATASQNYVALAKATAEYNLAIQNLRKLDAGQKELIRQSNLALFRSHIATRFNLHRQGVQNIHLGILEGHFSMNSPPPPKLAVRPDDADLAPTYSPEKDFENKQALVQKWQYTLQIIPPLHRLVDGKFKFEKSCAITLREENHTWEPKVKRGKYL